MTIRSGGSGRRIGAVLLVAVLALLAGCTRGEFDDRDQGRWAGDAGRVETAPDTSRSAVGPRGDSAESIFELASGVTAITIRVGDLDDDLYRISTPAASRVAPVVHDHAGVQRLTLKDTGDAGPAAVEVLLHRDVRWKLLLGGGADQHMIDLTGGRVAGVDFTAGVARIGLRLPAPEGTVVITMSGGASRFDLSAPDQVPVRVRLDGGAGSATVDGATRPGVAGGTVIDGTGWADTTNRYDVAASAGVGTFTLDRLGSG